MTHKKHSFFYSLTEDFRSLSGICSLLSLFLALVFVRSFIISPFRIPSGSMIPTLLVGDHIMATKFSYGWSRYSILFGGYFNYFAGRIGFKPPKRGDIAVFANPRDTSIDYIKRIVGIPGDTVQMIGGHLCINGKKMPVVKEPGIYKSHDGRDYIKGEIYATSVPRDDGTLCRFKILKQEPFGVGDVDNTPPIYVKKGHYCFVGDNRDGSTDTRDPEGMGLVNENLLEAKALFVWLSLNHDEIYLFKPWTWLKIPFKIRYTQCLRWIQ